MTEPSRSEIHIVLAFDDNFWAPAFAVMRSVALHTRRRKDLRFHLLHMPLTEEHMTDLRRIETEFGAQLVWYDLTKVATFGEMIQELPEIERISKVAYARMIVDQLIDPAITRIIYLDCDVLVRDNIEKLYEVDLQGEPLAAVPDAWGPFFAFGADYMQRDVFDPADRYFNSGVMVIDLPLWREAEVGKRVSQLVASGTAQALFMDQDLLNLIFPDRWHPLPVTWNMMNARPPHESLRPSIVHYTGDDKPWALVGPGAYRRMYRRMMTNELFYRFMRHRWKRKVRRWLRLG